ncbi:DDE_3 domain-containing protein [Trichonephila clavipes]|nr:DDE_3 domain-containing protein [Trichonephila clavipes]
MTGHIYRDVILEKNVRLFREAMDAEFLFVVDNAHPHRAIIVDECLQLEDISRMDWPAYSLVLNPIDHVWDMLGRRIAARQPLPTCLPELRRALLDEWCKIPQDQIDNLILSMPRRFLKELHGSPTGVHFGVMKTFQKVRERFYWNNVRSDEEKCCGTCDLCAARKGPRKRTRGRLQLYNVGASFERIAFDILGPLPRSSDGNNNILVGMDYFTK